MASIPELGVMAYEDIDVASGTSLFFYLLRRNVGGNWYTLNLTVWNPDLWWPAGVGSDTRTL